MVVSRLSGGGIMLYTRANPRPPTGRRLSGSQRETLNTGRKLKTKPKNFRKSPKNKGGPGEMKRISVLKNFFCFSSKAQNPSKSNTLSYTYP